MALSKQLPFEVDLNQLADEWKILRYEENIQEEVSAIDEDWSFIFDIKNNINEIKYSTVTKVVKTILRLSHGSATIERGFSTSGLVLTRDKTSMNERGINTRLNVISGMKGFKNNPSLTPMSKELIMLATNAHRSYQAYLLEEKGDKKMRIKKEEEKMLFNKKREEADTLKELAKALVEKQKTEEEKKEAAEKLFEEANKWLESGMKRQTNGLSQE